MKEVLAGPILDRDKDGALRTAELNRVENQVEDQAVKEVGVSG
jgi:hypothetical protein